MSYKVFTNGSVLNASELNEFLMNQSVIAFSNSTARSSAITTPVEGMLTYLEDTNTYQFWNGSAWTNLLATSGAGSGNLIINGAFEINQRGYVSGTNLASGSYGFDRWKSTFTNTSLTFTSAPQGQEVTISSGGSIEQIVERQNLPAGTYTLSWTGTATGRIYNTGATPPSYAASPITVTLDGLANVEVEFTASGGTRTLSRVQLESGSAATTFRRNATTRQGELAACQRYYFRQSLGETYANFANGMASSGSNCQLQIRLPVTARAIPTSVEVGGNLSLYDSTNLISITTTVLSSNQQSLSVATLSIGATGLVQFRPYFLIANDSAAAFVAINMEL